MFRVWGASFSSFVCFVFDFWVLRFRDLGASFSSLGCFIFEIWVLPFRELGSSCFGLRFRVLRFRNYQTLTLVESGLMSESQQGPENCDVISGKRYCLD